MEQLRLVSQPVRRQLEEHLRRAIIDGLYPPGSHLSDRALCEQFGVSRSVVREAVRLLEAEGLVTLIPHRGPFVAFLSAEEAAQIYEVRAALEGLAGAGFAQRASEPQRDALRDVYAALATAEGGADKRELLDLKRRFYDVLLAGCGNAYVARMLAQVLNRNTQLRATSLSAPNRLPHTIREIGEIVEAVLRRDPHAARRACIAHVEAAATIALAILSENERSAARSTGKRNTLPR